MEGGAFLAGKLMIILILVLKNRSTFVIIKFQQRKQG